MKKIAALLLVSSIIACQSETKKTEPALEQAVADTISYKYDTVKVYSQKVVARDENLKDTTKASFIYPVFKQQRLDSIVQANTIASSNPDEPAYKNPQEAAAAFVKKYDTFRAENDDAVQTWFKEVTVTVMPQRKNYLGLKYFFIEYAGGAHPNSAIIFKNYDPKTFKEITLDELIPAAKQTQLKAVAEKIFRAQEKLGPTESLADKYFFDKGIYTLNNNFTITDQGLKFLYNSYEIKPYSEGVTELLIPYSAIKDLLNAHPAIPEFK
ncbi:DUF3298 domain-containing protein [Pedobacter sp.]|uniref:DUF3298 and DUF4163 domain-containing protein n=1 Tax=Pedobacter sp. TaxID=1411316 RepID=UPI003D7FF88D